MPNWCLNEVKASEKVLNEIYDKEKGQATFQKLMPMPKSLLVTAGGYDKQAMAYSLIKKEDAERENLLNQIKSKNTYHYNKITEYLGKNKDLQDELEKINKDYKPNNEETKLGIKNLEDLGNTYISNIISYGYSNWYEWCNVNWGTKWDANHIYGSPEEGCISFYTAWCPPEGIVGKLFEKFPDEDIDWYYEEPGMDFAGNFTPDFEGGVIDTPCAVPNYFEEDYEEMEESE